MNEPIFKTFRRIIFPNKTGRASEGKSGVFATKKGKGLILEGYVRRQGKVWCKRIAVFSPTTGDWLRNEKAVRFQLEKWVAKKREQHSEPYVVIVKRKCHFNRTKK